MTTTETLGGYETAEALEQARSRAVTTRVESFGELVDEPGMSREEAVVRTAAVLWRNGGAERVRRAAELEVAEGRWTREQADAHIREQESQAETFRALVVRCDEERAARLREGKPAGGV